MGSRSKTPSANELPGPRTIEDDEVSALEDIHTLITDANIFVSIADELDHDERWPGRIAVLLRLASGTVDHAHESIRKLVTEIYRRRRRASKKSR